jgi:hypothetical protein
MTQDQCRTLDDTRHYLPELRDLISKLGAVQVIPEERLNPVVDVVWYLQLQVFIEHSAVPDTVEGFRKIQRVHDNKPVGIKESCDGVEEMN